MSSATASFSALGTGAIVVAADSVALEAGLAEIQATIEEFDRSCSRFRDDSELTRLNAASGHPVRVGPLLLEAVAQALRAAEVTGGDVDPTVGVALEGIGYDRDFDSITGSARVRFSRAPGWRTVRLDPAGSMITLPLGVRLDLGATAKALAADHAAARAAELTGAGFLVSLGGDIATAGPAPEDGWRVRVTDDHRSAELAGQTISIRSGGLATSSTTVRRWRAGGRELHHILEPGTGRPAQGEWRTASVCAASCLEANIASTAAIIRGARAEGWLRSLALPSRLVGRDGRARHLAGWPAEGDELG